MVKTKSIEQIKARYKAGASGASETYKQGVAAANDWQQNAAAAEPLYAQKIQEAVANQSRRKGIEKTSNEDWRKAAVEKGSARISTGMLAAADKQAAHVAPFIAALQSVQLPPRSADPMANIDARTKPIVKALVDKKKEMRG